MQVTTLKLQAANINDYITIYSLFFHKTYRDIDKRSYITNLHILI